VDAASPVGAQVVHLRNWAEQQAANGASGDRDLAPGHSPRAWTQISLSGRECVGASCQYVGECFVQAARAEAAASQLVVTNHAVVAFEAEHGWAVLDPDVLVVDEAHELAARVTNCLTDELSPQMAERAARMAGSYLADDTQDELRGVVERFTEALETADPGLVRGGAILTAAADLRNVLRRVMSAVGHDAGDTRREQVANVVKEVFDIATRIAGGDEADVIWVSARPQFGSQLVVAPLRVDTAIREAILTHQPSILTSATLKLGDSFAPIEAAIGLGGPEAEEAVPYTAADVGSPFDYRRQGICYVASHLPPPGRDGTSDEALQEIADLVDAAGGHTLGLFSSMRAAERAADFVRYTTDKAVLLQGEGHLPDLIAQFLAEPALSLFGTISLWQGVDAPGETCHLVIVDRIPFPRPDEPLIQARQEDVSRRGGNGFMDVALRHAGLMLAQGTGRLIRRTTDRGVVAILDSRLLKARYGRFLLTSMPPLWMTTDRQVVLDALDRLGVVGTVGVDGPGPVREAPVVP
jgi:ATP-dependent DNA helicase DinG